MSSVNFHRMKEELKAFGIDFSENESPKRLREKFDALPITEGQIEHLLRQDVRYKEEWNWTRGFASDFIRKCDEYYKLLNELPVSPKQMVILLDKGIEIKEGLTSGEAAKIIYNLPATEEQLLYIKKYNLKVSVGVELTYGYCQYLIGKRENFIKGSRMKSVKKSD